jgi:hypothetical protein
MSEAGNCCNQVILRRDVARDMVQLVVTSACSRERPLAPINARYF